MVDLSFEVNGQTVEPYELEIVLTETSLVDIAETIEVILDEICCPVHGLPLINAIVRFNEGEDIAIEVRACCDTAVFAIQKAVGNLSY